jgi:DNA polymerase II large subunit
MNVDDYFLSLDKEVARGYELAGKARSKGLDPVNHVEVPLATSLAARVTGLVSVLYPQIIDERITKRILELEKQHGPLDPAIALTIAEEIAKETFCKFKDHHQAIEAGIRVAIGYLTLGYVSSPIEGFVELKLKKTAKGEDYFAPYFSGPIRSAGGTEEAFSLVIVDYLREIFGYARYDPTEDEVKRGIHECYEYHDRVTNLQYLPPEKELDFLMKHIPVQVSGDPSEDKEVYNFKDLPRLETNSLRSGFCLVMCEGMAQKAPKILKRIIKLREKGFALTGWSWLEDFVKFQKSLKESKAGDSGSRAGATYIQDLVAGRPVFAHPSMSGAFRLRYGRCRNSGYSTLALHPATMAVTGDFISVGTQLKIEKPTKGCTCAACDSIDGPIVKLTDGSVKRVSTVLDARALLPSISEIIYLGDILVPYGDFTSRNHPLEKAGYVEQYWLEHLKKAGGSSALFPTFDEAVLLSRSFSIPLHPSFIFFWTELSKDDFFALIDWLARASFDSALVLPYTKVDQERFSRAKRALELLGCEHRVTIENVVIAETEARALLLNFGIDSTLSLEEVFDKVISRLPSEGTVLEMVNSVSSIKIYDKAGTFIGARMGRPEKAKLRKLIGSPHALFPVGSEGGRLRSLLTAVDVGTVSAEFPTFFCADCRKETIYPTCEFCNGSSKKMYFCPKCDKLYDGSCPDHDMALTHRTKSVPIREYFDRAKQLAGVRIEELPVAVKGVKGTSNKDHMCENIAKGLLRAKYDLHVNKDGTIRYDMTEMPITHFKPKEVGTSVEKLRSLGYDFDIHGLALTNDDQVLEMFPHDIILPACPITPDERADDVFFNVARFVDDELVKLYDQQPFFNLKDKKDLVGSLLACMSPHTSATVVGRLIGFSKFQALLASPYIHGAMRRDCDGDEAAVMLLMDLLLNFSRTFLPAHRGGTQDAPLVLNTRIRANEVDDMVFDLDVSKYIPLELYEAGERHASPSEVKMEQIKSRLGTGREFNDISFSYDTNDINDAPLCSSYKTLPTMQDKVDAMMALCSKIRAVDVQDVARLTIERHFIRDIRGNLRKFSMQVFRCVSCNDKFRRPPLSGVCTKCGGKLLFTISEGSIIKYLASALDLARTYSVSPYLLECLEVTEKDIQGIFGKEKEKQLALNAWFK